VVRVLKNEKAREGVEAHIARLLQTARVEAEPVIMIEPDVEHSLPVVFERATRQSDLVFLGLPSFEEGAFVARSRFLQDLLRQAPSSVLVRSAEAADILDAEADEPTR
jgi:predicted component of type VI protein secretion system